MADEMTNVVACPKHGPQPKACVCGHVLHSLHDLQPRGFFYSVDTDQEYPDAWCRECDDRLRGAGGAWTDELEKLSDIRLVCASCYQTAKTLNSAVSP